MLKLFSIFLVLTAFSMVLQMPAAAQADLLPIEHNTLPFLTDRPVVGEPSRDRLMQISVALRVSDRPQLDALIEQLYDPASPLYHHFLSREAFVSQFGPRPQAHDAVIDFLRLHGLHVKATYANRMVVDAEGTVAQVEAAFGVSVHAYAAEDGTTFIANDRDPVMPTALANVVGSVAGLDDYTEMTSHVLASPPPRTSRSRGAPSGFSPEQIAAAYDFKPVYASGNNGEGATIAIATAFGFKPADSRAFWQKFGIPAPHYTVVRVGGPVPHPNLETTLDIEQTGGLAPGARILIYEGANGKFSTFQSVYNRIVSENRASVVTTSWGICEREMPAAALTADSGIFAEAAAQGQTWFAASGDNGAYDCGDPRLAVDYPASDPNVSSANGTSLSLTAGNTIAAEWAWRGSGGGLSVAFNEPFYQSGVDLVNGYSNGMRQAADVAFNSDPLTGYPVLFRNTWSEYGGTSFAAPAWAAIFALVNAARGSSGRVGAASPNLYEMENGALEQPYPAFHDIVSGTNSYYAAVTGWDYATGWGSPDVANLVVDLK
jgi:subtilase family serine protease